MYTLITKSTFVNAFDRADRSENFSHEGRRALFNWFEELDADVHGADHPGTEFDVIAICCEFNEMDVDDIIREYRVDVEEDADEEERADAVEEYLSENTSLVGKLSNGCFVFAAF